MRPIFKNYGSVMISLIGAIAIVFAAILGKGTAYENVWLYIFCVQIVLAPLWDTYVKRSK